MGFPWLRTWVLVAVLALVGAAAPPAGRHRLHASRATTPPKIDGRIELLEWQSAAPTTLLSRDARSRCVVYALNDEKHLFWAFDALDDGTNTTGRGASGVFDNVAVWFGG